MYSQNIFDMINELDNAAKIPALRAICNSTMAKAIGAIRQHLRDEARRERDEKILISLNQRNELDDERGIAEQNEAMGFGQKISAIKQASMLHAVYDWALHELKNVSTSKWDRPMDVDGMLDFMTSQNRPIDPALAKALAAAANTNEKTIEQLYETQNKQDQEDLKQQRLNIRDQFLGFGDNGYESAVLELPATTQHQLGVKTVESLKKAKDRVLVNVLRSRKLDDLGNIPLIDEGIQVLTKWVENFETRHKTELEEAMNYGTDLNTL